MVAQGRKCARPEAAQAFLRVPDAGCAAEDRGFSRRTEPAPFSARTALPSFHKRGILCCTGFSAPGIKYVMSATPSGWASSSLRRPPGSLCCTWCGQGEGRTRKSRACQRAAGLVSVGRERVSCRHRSWEGAPARRPGCSFGVPSAGQVVSGVTTAPCASAPRSRSLPCGLVLAGMEF